MKTSVTKKASLMAQDDPDLHGPELTAKQDRFALLWAERGNKSVAYKMAYDVSPGLSPGSIYSGAVVLANMPKIRARYDHYMRMAVEGAMINMREVIYQDYEIATADPADLVRVVVHNCRYCNGVDFQHQWIDDVEYMTAIDKAMEEKAKQLPSDAGGYGFQAQGEVNAACPHCVGQGIATVIIADLTRLEGKARRLYKGAKVDRFGCIEIQMHSQGEARDRLYRASGITKDGTDLRTQAEREMASQRTRLPENVSTEDASKAYLAMLSRT